LAEGSVCAECGHRNPDDLVVDPSEDDIRVERGDLPPDVGVLVLTTGADVGMRYVLSPPLTTAGRHPRSDIFLDDITVSRRHVEVSRSPAGYVLRDVGSLNGTYVDRTSVDQAVLRGGDEVQIGKYRLQFLTGGEQPEGES
jgi:pSer/pThr/pTyr-binding forkhead associated (FHA) protein